MVIALNVDGNGATSIRNGMDIMSNKTTKTTATTNRNARKPRTSGIASTPVNSLADMITVARSVTVATFAATLDRVNRDHGVLHAGRHVARFTAWRVMYAQNETLRLNADWQLDDVQLLFVWRALFPMSSGKLFTGSIADGIAIVRGVRADYNRTGHGMPSGKPAIESVSYGAKRFDIPGTSVGTVPPNPVIVEPVKPAARKPATVRTRKTA